MIAFSFVRQKAAGRDPLDFKVRRINQRFVVLIEPAGAGLVKLGRPLLVERLVGSLVIVGVLPAVEAALLGAVVG